jgi:hypothetical protein
MPVVSVMGAEEVRHRLKEPQGGVTQGSYGQDDNCGNASYQDGVLGGGCAAF